MKVVSALISVSDKKGLAGFGRRLDLLGVSIISTGGTAKHLVEIAGVPVTTIGDFTGFPEIMDGRVKTLHPKVHGGILAIRDNEAHLQEARKNGIEFIDLVVVNLYPFRETIARPGVTFAEAVEQIDIGGPAMVRSAAKSFEYVGVVVDPGDYDGVIGEIANNGGLSGRTRFELARKAFAHTRDYDAAIESYLAAQVGMMSGFYGH